MADWISAIAAVGAGLIAIVAAIFAWWSAKSAEKQNELALHQRKVDAYKSFQEHFEEWLASDHKNDPKLFRQLRSSNAVVKFLFKVEVHDEFDGLLAKIREMIGLKAGQKNLHEFINNAPGSDEARYLRNIAGEKGEKYMSLDAGLEEHYSKCLDLLEQEINLFRK